MEQKDTIDANSINILEKCKDINQNQTFGYGFFKDSMDRIEYDLTNITDESNKVENYFKNISKTVDNQSEEINKISRQIEFHEEKLNEINVVKNVSTVILNSIKDLKKLEVGPGEKTDIIKEFSTEILNSIQDLKKMENESGEKIIQTELKSFSSEILKSIQDSKNQAGADNNSKLKPSDPRINNANINQLRSDINNDLNKFKEIFKNETLTLCNTTLNQGFDPVLKKIDIVQDR